MRRVNEGSGVSVLMVHLAYAAAMLAAATNALQVRCLPGHSPPPVLELVSPANHAKNVPVLNVRIVVASNYATALNAYPWVLIPSVELVPASGLVKYSRQRALLKRIPIDVAFSPAQPGTYSYASFQFSGIDPASNYRIVVETIEPSGQKQCPDERTKIVLGEFSSAP